MKIEHWRSQSRFRDQELDYRNLLGACLGGECQPRARQHCDTRKRDSDLYWNPADPDRSATTEIIYGVDGTISSGNERLSREIEDVLNLNLNELRAHRRKVLDAILDWEENAQGKLTTGQIERWIRRTDTRDGYLPPYCGVALWWLRRKIEQST